jgi:zinc transport system substrate-binding protein
LQRITRIVIVWPMRIVLALLLVGAAGCGAATAGSRTTIAAFYPLAFAAERLGGTGVTNLTPPGAEPHDIELTPKEVGSIQRADVVLYLSHDFQPAVEQAVKGASGTTVDVLQGIHLRGGVGDEAGKTDPHVWLDPVLYAGIVKQIGGALDRPSRAKALAARLLKLDRTFRTGLGQCVRRDIVTSHAAFGYLAARYGLRQLPITGMDPESEPSPQRLASLARLVKREHITTVFFEKLTSPRLAQTIAREAGVKTAVLDPIEGLTPAEAEQGWTYFTLMRRNLAALRLALGCR